MDPDDQEMNPAVLARFILTLPIASLILTGIRGNKAEGNILHD